MRFGIADERGDRSGATAARNRPDRPPARLSGQTESGATALLGILNDIPDYSKIEAGHLQVEAIPLRVSAVQRDSGAVRAPGRTKTPDAESFTVAPDVPEVLCGDPLRLGQVLQKIWSATPSSSLNTGLFRCKSSAFRPGSRAFG